MSSGGTSPGGGGAPTGTAGGDLGGTYPNPTVDLNTAGGTLNGSVAVVPADSTPGLTITHPSADTTKILNLTGVHTVFTLDCDGTFSYTSDDSAFMLVRGTSGTSAVLQVQDASTNSVSHTISSSGGFTAQAVGNKTDLLQAKNNAGNRVFRARTDSVSIKQNAAPADADLFPGEMALWMDSTNGAPRFMVKAKQADGTVVTGLVVLT